MSGCPVIATIMLLDRPLTPLVTGTIRDQAHALRAGLLAGYAAVSDVIAWADLLIAEDRGREVRELFDLALVRPNDVGRAVSLLGEVPGELNAGEVGRHIAKLVREALASGTFTERRAATALYRAMREGLSPDEEFERIAYYFDDAVDLAQEGIYGNLADVRSEMLEYLAKVKGNQDETTDRDA